MLLTWNEICDDPSLQNLPYKIETNRWGQIVMSPAKHWHSKRQGRIMGHLQSLIQSGEVYAELAVSTAEGVKVMDVGWATADFDAIHSEEDTLTAAPNLCVEVLSKSNSREEIEQKIQIYFAYGAEEVWTCDDSGQMHFYTHPTTEEQTSRLFPAFPVQV